VRFDGHPAKVKPSPLLGQHNADVLGSWLGMPAAEIDGLKADGIISA
jgi:crotonobetainyl-CoA:carnitine CoA-transferase CaiB-like acyl-CoA transferase